MLGINLVIGFIPGFNVAWQAHVGGLVVGALVAFIFARTRQRSRQALQIWLLIGVVVLLLIAQPAVLRLLGLLTSRVFHRRRVIHRFIHSWG